MVIKALNVGDGFEIIQQHLLQGMLIHIAVQSAGPQFGSLFIIHWRVQHDDMAFVAGFFCQPGSEGRMGQERQINRRWQGHGLFAEFAVITDIVNDQQQLSGAAQGRDQSCQQCQAQRQTDPGKSVCPGTAVVQALLLTQSQNADTTQQGVGFIQLEVLFQQAAFGGLCAFAFAVGLFVSVFCRI